MKNGIYRKNHSPDWPDISVPDTMRKPFSEEGGSKFHWQGDSKLHIAPAASRRISTQSVITNSRRLQKEEPNCRVLISTSPAD
ncbi:hypothetical protein T07_6104 [Trichinella nelsoni]|uniref:Uncharacterized protein n=1 Tax=Trichinella nelsoni TaxID=6336 RepID=A0A0V0SAR9_9BILA|nr:hypothetical protein T07_6104 [Trichinella nelsoni]